ncbi:short-chain dehydrogenase [Lactiplantibacillus fabifermentans T30PCM01]|uniref:Short-chain dehydrogenase n=1 Tax=Lactiplantibacillus fabifermentans T30PCM01 TaxID=1400520 RepID=W6T4G0_9LACO|nr:SDR family NAD(P)-dependent oxidoreductase [Lactiplantibacillus fabifermentans]ETY72583.1 short-chain dehydrogenase [Lactiplantibacillus fabifermentans T30PCM01]
MTKIFITGSTDGLGFLTAKRLMDAGNEVVLHARNHQRAAEVKRKLPQAKNIVIGDLSSQTAVESLANQLNDLGPFDTIIHNAGVYTGNSALTFQVNVLAPYLLTALVKRPKRLIYISSGMHYGSRLDLKDLTNLDYSGSKLQVLLLAKLLAQRWPNVTTTIVDPGWVPTKMGGAAANDDLTLGYTTQVWLATLADTSVTGTYYHHMKPARYDARVDNQAIQNKFLIALENATGVKLPC